MKCLNCEYDGLIDQHCPQCGMDIYSTEYEKLAEH